MSDQPIKEAAELIVRDFELEATESEITEDELFRILADRIAWLIECRMEFLLSLMYRLDISETKVSEALSPANPEAANLALARLVLDRQKLRIKTKQEYKQDDLDEWGW